MNDIRFHRIVTAYEEALHGRDAAIVDVRDLLPVIFNAVPDTEHREIVDALRWAADREVAEADELERYDDRSRT